MWIGTGNEKAIFLADLCPTTAHLDMMWTMSYDQFPLQVRHTKPRVLVKIVEENHLALFEHDTTVRAARLGRDEKNQVVLKEQVALNDD